METPRKRRTILKGLMGTSLAAIAAPIVYVMGRYLSYIKTSDMNATVTLSSEELTSEMPSKIITIEDDPVIVVLEKDKGLRAFTAKCTHLGCTVSYRPEQPGFYCKCHQGKYDLNGINVPGTRPKRPLTELTVTQEGSEIHISLQPKKSA